MKNHYDTLEIRSTANVEQIKKAFRVLAIKYHPDKTQDDEYFTKKFIAVREAYECLSNPQKRKEYDDLYSQIFEQQTNEQKEKVREEKQKEKEKEERFFYEPFRSFYSIRDREQQETPQFNPIMNFLGEKLSENSIFFARPKRIGKIICGMSNLYKSTEIYTEKQKVERIVKNALIGLGIGTIIFFLARLSDPIWIIIWFTAPTLIAIWFASATNSFKHYNYFVGVNGFAEYVCEDSVENIVISKEINFNDVTNLYVFQADKRTKGNYVATEFIYAWLNFTSNKNSYAKEGSYNKTSEIKLQSFHINFCRAAEKYWTVYLLDNMESKLQKQGFIEFNLYSHEKNTYLKYIKLGIGFITFIKGGNEEFTYKFNEIKKMYSKGDVLHVQHNNFERKLYFLKSGNEDLIPLSALCNRQFFYRATELLLGYQIN